MAGDAPWDIYQEEMIRLCNGLPIWQASPESGPHVRVGDFGFMQRGRFVLIFNAIDPGERKTPQGFTALKLPEQDPLYSSDAHWDNPLCTNSLKDVGASLKIGTSGAPISVNANVKVLARSGAALAFLTGVTCTDANHEGVFRKYLLEWYDIVHKFACDMGFHLGLSDLIFVTGCDLTGDHAMLAFREERVVEIELGLDISVPVPGPLSVGANTSIRWRVGPFAQTNGGPSTPAKEDRKCCVFIRGWRIKRLVVRYSARLKGGAATPPEASDIEDNKENLPSELSRVEAYAGRSDGGSISVKLEEISGIPPHNDPVEVLFKYITDNCAEALLAMVHDDHLVQLMQLGDLHDEGIGYLEMLNKIRPQIVLEGTGAAWIDFEPVSKIEVMEPASSVSVPMVITSAVLPDHSGAPLQLAGGAASDSPYNLPQEFLEFAQEIILTCQVARSSRSAALSMAQLMSNLLQEVTSTMTAHPLDKLGHEELQRQLTTLWEILVKIRDNMRMMTALGRWKAIVNRHKNRRLIKEMKGELTSWFRRFMLWLDRHDRPAQRTSEQEMIADVPTDDIAQSASVPLDIESSRILLHFMNREYESEIAVSTDLDMTRTPSTSSASET